MGESVVSGMATLKDAIHTQNQYIAAMGGILNIHESDDIYNDMNREQIARILDRHGKLYLGKINVDLEAKHDILSGGSPFTEYTGGLVRNFSCDFAVPVADDELAALIRRWIGGDTAIPVLDGIINRVDQIGGVIIRWT